MLDVFLSAQVQKKVRSSLCVSVCSSTGNGGVMPTHQQRQPVYIQLRSYVLEVKHFCAENVLDFRFGAWISCQQHQWKFGTALELRRCNTDA